jgi:hypothetical protein
VLHDGSDCPGKLLSQGVRDIYDEFVATMERWHHIEFDIIDIGAEEFTTDYERFRDTMRELDRRLCQVVLAAFDDCATMTATFKLLDSFEGLLDRDVISQVRQAAQLRADTGLAGRTCGEYARMLCAQQGRRVCCRRWRRSTCSC